MTAQHQACNLPITETYPDPGGLAFYNQGRCQSATDGAVERCVVLYS